MAEEVGFEPTVPCGTTVFKTAAFNHSAIPPRLHQDSTYLVEGDRCTMRDACEWDVREWDARKQNAPGRMRRCAQVAGV